MKKVMIVATALLFLAAAASPTLAFHGKGRRGGPYAGSGVCGNPAAMQGLNLSADQKAKIEALRTAHLKEVKPLRDKLFSRSGDLKILWLEKNPNQEKITSMQKEIRALRDQIQDKRTSHHFEVMKVLTPEQQEKFRTACMRGGKGGRGPGQGMGRGPGQGMGRGMGM
ncbi:MAG: Spy/CpxP family protein refolding chaperone [Syntrophales bacterium]|nr:Spy/CpxP family protein refolding chaperone [Syntrophales bacterium]MDD5234237.1 Spy/CpxP family protein refolding chaperone [Syntrophales bacterium]MDD5532210.1 Spy/CpxP family protein refolding chaperone [Syntrophales bacterium]